MNRIIVFIFIFGLIIGSFLNVCIYRLPRHQSIVFTRSHCTSCGTPIKYYDLIPVVSYFLLGGRCRLCKSRVSPQYPIIELITALLFAVQYWKCGLSLPFFLLSSLTAVLIVILAVDYFHQIIPNGFILASALFGVIYLAAVRIPSGLSAVLDSAVGFVIGGGLFLLIAIVSKGGMGGGDIKLMAVLGLWFGWKKILLIAMLAFFIGAAVSLVLLLLHRKSGRDAIPFGPFIAISAYLVSIFGDAMLYGYFHYITAV